MDRKECTARLMASAMHEMRNALAVIRESVGLACDVERIRARGGEAAAQIPKGMTARTVKDLDEVQNQVSRASEIADAVDCLSEAIDGENSEASCDLGLVVAMFCVLARRRARAFHMELCAEGPQEPVWCAQPAISVFVELLSIFDVCASAGGDVRVEFKALRRKQGNGVLISLTKGGDSMGLVISALTGCSRLLPDRGGWAAHLVPWGQGDQKHFWLALEPGQPA